MALAAVAVIGCNDGTPTDKAGGSARPLELRLATPDRPGLPGSNAIEHFRGEVTQLSDGRIRIVPVYQAAGEAPRFDQAVADLVRAGRMDLALVPARAWDEYGVRSLRALQAPFLIRDQTILRKVVAGDLARPLLQGLPHAGITGLALLPENLRHPFGFGHALVSLRDFTDTRIRVPRSVATYELLRALGARPVDLDGDAFKRAVRDRSVVAAESAFELAESTLPAVATGTSNITFFPKVNVLVANSRALRRLDNEQRQILDAAAGRTLAWVLRTMPSEDDAAHAYCRQGGRVTAATAADVRALVRAAEPQYARLERDSQTGELVRRIRALTPAANASTAEDAVTCAPAGLEQDARSTTGHNTAVLDGIYRNEITVDEMIAAGVNAARARDNAGLHTITLSNGHLHDTSRSDATGVTGKPCDATYRLSGHHYTFRWKPGGDCTGDFTATWTVTNGELRLSNIHTADRVDRVLWGLKPFRKIG